MIYEYRCSNKECQEKFEMAKSVEMSSSPAWCPVCNSPASRLISSGIQTRVANNELKTDFGAGAGEKVYTRHEYLETCKQLKRDPVGLAFQGLKGKRI